MKDERLTNWDAAKRTNGVECFLDIGYINANEYAQNHEYQDGWCEKTV